MGLGACLVVLVDWLQGSRLQIAPRIICNLPTIEVADQKKV